MAEEANNTFREGDLVLLQHMDLEKARGQKLEAQWSGPFIIHQVLNKQQSVILYDLASGLPFGKHHINNIKRFYPHSDDSREEAACLAEQNTRQKFEMEEVLQKYQHKKKDSTAAPSQSVKVPVTKEIIDGTVMDDYWKGVDLYNYL